MHLLRRCNVWQRNGECSQAGCNPLKMDRCALIASLLSSCRLIDSSAESAQVGAENSSWGPSPRLSQLHAHNLCIRRATVYTCQGSDPNGLIFAAASGIHPPIDSKAIHSLGGVKIAHYLLERGPFSRRRQQRVCVHGNRLFQMPRHFRWWRRSDGHPRPRRGVTRQ